MIPCLLFYFKIPCRRVFLGGCPSCLFSYYPEGGILAQAQRPKPPSPTFCVLSTTLSESYGHHKYPHLQAVYSSEVIQLPYVLMGIALWQSFHLSTPMHEVPFKGFKRSTLVSKLLKKILHAECHFHSTAPSTSVVNSNVGGCVCAAEMFLIYPRRLEDGLKASGEKSLSLLCPHIHILSYSDLHSKETSLLEEGWQSVRCSAWLHLNVPFFQF